MPKCNFNKDASNFIAITLLHGCSPANLLHISKTRSPKKTSGAPLLLVNHRMQVSWTVARQNIIPDGHLPKGHNPKRQ